MKLSHSFTLGLATLLGIALSTGCTASPDPKPHATGLVRLKKHGEGNRECELEIRSRDAANMQNYDCKNDEVDRFELVNAPPGSRIVFGSEMPSDGDKDCKEDGDWWYVLFITSETPVDLPWHYLSSIDETELGGYMGPGVRLVGKKYRRGTINGKLSCVDTEVKNPARY